MFKDVVTSKQELADPQKLPSFAQMLWDQVPTAHGGVRSVEDYARDLDKRVRDGLY